MYIPFPLDDSCIERRRGKKPQTIVIFFLFTQNMTTFNDENGKDQSWSLQILQFIIFCPELLDIKGKNKVQLWRLSFVCFCLRKQGNNKLTNIYKDSWVISRICEQHLCLPWGKQEVYWKVTNVDVKAHPCFWFFFLEKMFWYEFIICRMFPDLTSVFCLTNLYLKK